MTSQDRIKESAPQTEPSVAATAEQDEGTNRLEAFSDGVFAIAITLLVLDIHVPNFSTDLANQSLLDYLGDEWPVYLAYLISFLTIGIIWINHHVVFKYVKHSSRSLLNINLLLLLATSFIPFPTELLGDAIKAEVLNQGVQHSANLNTAAAVYSGTLLVMGIIFNWLWIYVSRGHRLVDEGIPDAVLKGREKASQLGNAFYAVAFIFAFISVPVSVGITLLVALIFFLPNAGDRF